MLSKLNYLISRIGKRHGDDSGQKSNGGLNNEIIIDKNVIEKKVQYFTY